LRESSGGAFEMQHVIPGADAENFDAAERNDAGDHAGAWMPISATSNSAVLTGCEMLTPFV
jgi:hypothetical protein